MMSQFSPARSPKAPIFQSFMTGNPNRFYVPCPQGSPHQESAPARLADGAAAISLDRMFLWTGCFDAFFPQLAARVRRIHSNGVVSFFSAAIVSFTKDPHPLPSEGRGQGFESRPPLAST